MTFHDSHTPGRHGLSPTRILAQALLCFAMALLMFFRFHKPHAAIGLLVMCGVISVLGWKAPHILALIDRPISKFARAVGLVMSWVMLVPFFWLCMVPGRLILMALGKDPMRRKWEPTATTYWTPKEKRSGGAQSQF